MKPNQIQTADDLENAFKEWNTDIYRYIYARLRNQETAQDIAQEVFIKAWRARDSFDARKSSLKNWLYRIAINTIRDYLRKYRNKKEVSLDENIPGNTQLKETIENKDLVNFVLKQVEKLTEREQELITLRYRQDLNVKEIAEITGIKYSAAKVALHRAVKKLQNLCDDESK